MFISLLIGLACLVAPMGAAAQNSVQGLAFLYFVFCFIRDGLSLERHTRTATILALLAFLWPVFSMYINPLNPGERLFYYLAGYLPFAVLPPLIAANARQFTTAHFKKAGWFIFWITLIMGLVALSQDWFGWQRRGLAFVASEHRARGFYSHPLTLAYGIVLLLPFATMKVIKTPKKLQSWVLFFSTFAIIWSSRSRVILVLSIVCVAGFVVWQLRAKWRNLCLGGLALSVFVVLLTNNPVGKNFRQTFDGGVDRHTDEYADDRLAFWHAHWVLFKQKPLVGHGFHIPKSLRYQAYDEIGLGSFQKRYTAHNQYLQWLCEGGAIGLILQLCFWGYLLWLTFNKSKTYFAALALFLAGLLTQNAFQDSEVRFILTLLVSSFYIRTQGNVRQLSVN